MSQYSDGAICPMGNRVIHLHWDYLKYDPESWRVTWTRITVLNISNTNSIEYSIRKNIMKHRLNMNVSEYCCDIQLQHQQLPLAALQSHYITTLMIRGLGMEKLDLSCSCLTFWWDVLSIWSGISFLNTDPDVTWDTNINGLLSQTVNAWQQNLYTDIKWIRPQSGVVLHTGVVIKIDLCNPWEGI